MVNSCWGAVGWGSINTCHAFDVMMLTLCCGGSAAVFVQVLELQKRLEAELERSPQHTCLALCRSPVKNPEM